MTYFTRDDKEKLRKASKAALEDTTASFTVALETKLNGIANSATKGATWGLNITSQPSIVSQAEAEAGTAAFERIWTAQRVSQAIASLGGAGSGDNGLLLAYFLGGT